MSTEQEVLDYEEVHDETVPDTAGEPQTEEIGRGSYSGIQAASFRDFLLKPALLQALSDCGFEHPSEVQQQCIPQAISGSDILCQAKSGMGKTAVFVLTCLHRLDTDKTPETPKVLVVTHTRELALQISNEFERFSKHFTGIHSSYFYGKVPIQDDIEKLQKKPAIVVGTPGRLNQLVREGHLNLSQIECFVLDECDVMLKDLDMRQDIQNLYLRTPHEKQVMMFSATLPQEVRPVALKFMRNPIQVLVDDEAKLTLHGLQQHYVNVDEAGKTKKLINLLDALEFNQVVVFVNKNERAKALHLLLESVGFPSMAIYGKMPQEERTRLYKSFKDFGFRILVASNLMARGIDIEKVNIVFNYDMPVDSDTYLHRVGRAGRFGTKGLAISFISSPDDKTVLEQISNRFQTKIDPLPDQISIDSYMNA